MSRLKSQLERLRENASGGSPSHHDSMIDAVDRQLDARLARNSAPNQRQPHSEPRFTSSLDHSRAAQSPNYASPAQPQYGVPLQPASAHPDMDRIRDSIEALSGKLASMAATRAESPVRQATSVAPALDMSSLHEAMEDFSRQMRAELSSVRKELSSAIQNVAQSGGNQGLEASLRQMSDAIAGLQGNASAGPSHLEEVAAELHAIREHFSEVSSQAPSHIDLGGVARSIESGYAEILSRIEETVSAAIGKGIEATSSHETLSRIAALSDHVSAIREQVEHAPVAALAEQIDQLHGSLDSLTGEGELSVGRNFAHINDRLDEITRALVAVSVNPASDNDSLDRIEARIATLAKAVDEIAERGPEQQPDTAPLDAIAEQLANLSARLDNLPAMGMAAAGMDEGSEIAARLDDIARRFDAMTIASGSPDPEFENNVANAFNSIDAQLVEIASRLDQMQSGVAPALDGEMAASTSSQIVDMLHALGERLEVVAAARPELPEQAQLEALERQLSGIVSQLSTVAASGFDLEPINQRLDNIEQQFVNSRDIAMEVANQAAERAASLVAENAGSASAPAMSADEIGALEQIVAEIRSLEENTRHLGERSTASFDAVRETMDMIGDRLNAIEDRLHAVSTAAPVQAARSHHMEVEAPARQHADAHGSHERMSAATMERPAESYLSEITHQPVHHSELQDAEAPGLHIDELPEMVRHEDEMAPEVYSEDQASMEVPEPEVDDVPLEPGSGVPDLEALMRQASARRKPAGQPAQETNTARETQDLIAQKRREVQAAQAAAKQREEAAPTKEKSGSRVKAPAALGSIAGILAGKKKLLLAAAAVAAIAIFAGPIAGRFLGGDNVEIVDEQPQPHAQGSDLASTGQTNAAQSEGSQSSGQSSVQPTDQPIVASSGDTQGGSGQEVASATATDQAGSALSQTAGQEPRQGGQAEQGAAPEAITSVPVPPVDTGNAVLRQAAASGDPEALFEIARRYTDGDGIERDLAAAAQWYEFSARAGFAPAQYRLANFHEKGHGVTVDIQKAALWYERAAEQGNALAMHNLAVLHASGLLDGRQDMEAATAWFAKAAELGVKDSQVNLGILYTRGKGVPEDLVEAYKWFSVAADGGDTDAAQKRDTLANSMRPDQLQTARGLAGLWKPAELDVSANTATIKPEWKNDQPGLSTELSPAEMIKRTQQLLATLGFDPGPADGVMGSKTRDAIRKFQERAGLPVSGEVNADLIARLSEASA
ncbi:MAG: peptidoglycan-binding protein [Rhizobiaceae bacterium]